jgi:hypothetical protein
MHGIFGALVGGLFKANDLAIVRYQEEWHHPCALHGLPLGPIQVNSLCF